MLPFAHGPRYINERLEGVIRTLLAMAGATSSADFPGVGRTRIRDLAPPLPEFSHPSVDSAKWSFTADREGAMKT
jgi:hypothetical protein